MLISVLAAVEDGTRLSPIGHPPLVRLVSLRANLALLDRLPLFSLHPCLNANLFWPNTRFLLPR